jgi:wingless-type MMTV integration site family, member 6
MKMPLFHEVGNRLKERFDGAVKVIANNDGNSFKADGETIKKPERNDLVYTEESPDFCRPNHKIGSLGTHGRECNITSYGIDGCELLCCNRGFDRKIKQFEVNCKCRFKWCCEVSCSKCIENREVYSCK